MSMERSVSLMCAGGVAETFDGVSSDRGADPEAGIVVDITAEDHARLREIMTRTATGPSPHFEAFFAEARLRLRELPRPLLQALGCFASDDNLDGVLFLRNLPTDPVVPPTPARTGARTHKPTWASELWMSCVAAALGEPVAYLQEKQGDLFQDIFPTPQSAGMLSSESSALLDFHTEIAFHPHMPDYLLLYCLRQDPDRRARTVFASVRRFVHRLSPDVRDTLYSPLFRAGVDLSFGNVEQQRGAGPLVSVLYGDRRDPFLRYDLDLMAGETPEAERALAVVRALVNEVKREVRLEPGSLLVLDNRRCVHARTEFKAYYDGRDRWLQRMAVVRDLEASRADRVRGTRVIATDFSRYFAAEVPLARPVEAR